jgi:hypothetical protein
MVVEVFSAAMVPADEAVFGILDCLGMAVPHLPS